MSKGDEHPTYEPADDEALEAELRALLERVDPVPERVLDAGHAAFAWRSIDEELAELAAIAELTHDSLIDDSPALAGVRSQAGPRTLTFESPALTLEIEVSASGGEERRLVGQLVPASRAEIFLEHRAGDAPTAAGVADELGRFVVDDVAAGDVRLRFSLGGGAEVRTRWMRL